MFSIIKRLLNFAGEYAVKLKIAFAISVFETIFAKIPIIAVLYIIIKIVLGSICIQDAGLIGSVLVISVILRIVAKRLTDKFQMGTGFEIFTRERIEIGGRLKRFPMGYFTDGNIGNVTAVITSDLVFIEEQSMKTLSTIITGYLNTIIGLIMLTVLDYRIGVISIITIALAMVVLNKIQNVVTHYSGVKQKTQSELISGVIEYVKGISVIKSFNIAGDKAKKVNNEFEKYRDVSIHFEKKFIPPLLAFDNCFTFGIGMTVLSAAYFAFNKTLDLPFMLMILIFIFEFYLPFKELGGTSAMIRIMKAGLDRYEEIKNTQIIDEQGKDIKLDNYDIEFKDVTFAYEEKTTLKNVSLKIPEKSMIALVGASGCGKTTIANLIARFWDVQNGEVLVGGVNVKEMTCDSLLKHISMVFQKVYLFNDTIYNNIKFGKADATREEIIEACKKARCHEFITKLENGYDTIVGEGGCTLSGGEKQRISIARAILKDAPIILLDEATASIDPDNEKHIQMAINELVKNKTLVVIAHRLSTIKSAHQILVMDDGKIIQKGTHAELIKAKGHYHDFWKRRMHARSWKILT
ncbi:MAG: ABC transporter ATP-binding protein/permease [Clostridia bacterium]|nr:ABC transporter ATP-binding protein/permease [Clostridia bacterium]